MSSSNPQQGSSYTTYQSGTNVQPFYDPGQLQDSRDQNAYGRMKENFSEIPIYRTKVRNRVKKFIKNIRDKFTPDV